MPLTMFTSPTDSMLTTSILLTPLYTEIDRDPALPLASVPLAVMDIAWPPSPFSLRRIVPAELPPVPPPSTTASCLVKPAPILSRFVKLRFAVGSAASSVVSREIRCSVDVVLMRGDAPAHRDAFRHVADFQLEPLANVLGRPQDDPLARVGPEARDRDDDRVGARPGRS